jgi:hypothetical protein
MSELPPTAPGRTWTIALVVAGLAGFAAAYGQAPLYYSNQNQYFLHGLARAGEGLLHEDWLANTADPTPIFSALVGATARYAHPWLFHIYYAVLLGVYAAALLGVFAMLVGREVAARRWPLFLALVVLVHSAAARWLSYRLVGLDYPWYLQAGVAGQYVLGPMLQPSTFGVLLVAAVALFALGRDIEAILCAAFGATIHSTYLLPAGFLTAGFMTTLLCEGRWRRAVAIGGLALLLVLPVMGYVLHTFAPSSPSQFARAQEILTNERIPHHCLPQLWLDPIAALQIGWIVLAVALLWRTRLFAAILVPVILATILTVVQVATGSDTLALLFPWRISAVLMPVATAIILARLVGLPALPLDRPVVSAIATVGIAVLAVAGIGICAVGLAFQSSADELPLLNYVREDRQPGDVYLIPVEVPNLKKTIRGSASSDFKPAAAKRKDTQVIPIGLQRFRLATEAPIFVDFKAIPYQDIDVIEWRHRLGVAQEIYRRIEAGAVAQAIAEMRRQGITHIVVSATTRIVDPGLTRLPFEDATYAIYRVVQ